MDWRPISADSHITEPPNCYVDHIDPAWRDKAPHVVNKDGLGDIYVVHGMKTPVPMGLVAAAGVAPQDIRDGRNDDRGLIVSEVGNETLVRQAFVVGVAAEQQHDGLWVTLRAEDVLAFEVLAGKRVVIDFHGGNLV